ncbi:MAG TPA: PLP-dependent transferase [Dermatophilaceae bacterium]|nr:PLP-dependent transferase [Dermatophilaceae bacterium]
MDHPHLAPATLLVAGGRPARAPGAGLSPPLELTSTYVADGPVNYGRAGNATWDAFEDVLGQLEGGQALVFASGMAAIAAAVSLTPHGGAVVVPDSPYSLTGVLLRELAGSGRVSVRPVAIADTARVVAALEGAALLWAESPTNPLLELADLPVITAAAHAQGALVVCDNTFATPLVQRPLDLGADVVVHSVTKYLAGHSDVLLGAAVTADTPAGRAAYQALSTYRLLHGAVAGPAETWLALRGLRTLHLRVERATTNAAELAARLRAHPAVERVRYPGWGAVVAIEVRGGAPGAEAVASGVQVWTHATSLGGVESLLERRRRNPAEPAVVPEQLLRLSVGIEDVEDLWRDLDDALRRATTGIS